MKTAKTTVTIYHNPRCSKSRATLALLQQHGVDPLVIEYLKTPPTKAELEEVIQKLGLEPAAIVRTGEEVYKAHFQGKALNDKQWIDALAANPILIERPIVVKGGRAVIGRPPEKVLDLL